jgi:hypothetical protein
MAAFASLFPWLEGFYTSGAMGEITLPELASLPYGVVVFGVVVVAVVGFWGAGRVERAFGTGGEQ